MMDAAMDMNEWSDVERGGRLVAEDATHSERNRAMLAHLLGMLGLIDHFVLGLIASLILYLTGRGESEFADDHAREAVNFQLSLLAYFFLGIALTVVTLGLGLLALIPAIIALWIVRLVAGIMASVAASRGEYYRYPVCIRFLS